MIVDANVLVRYFTGTPPAQAQAARELLLGDAPLRLLDVTIAEVAYVLGGVYAVSRATIAELLRGTIAASHVSVDRPQVILGALALFEAQRVDLADALLAAAALHDRTGVASFDRDFDRIAGVTRVEPPGRTP